MCSQHLKINPNGRLKYWYDEMFIMWAQREITKTSTAVYEISIHRLKLLVLLLYL